MTYDTSNINANAFFLSVNYQVFVTFLCIHTTMTDS